jgi:hypothetical protein
MVTDERLKAARDVTAEIDAMLAHKDAVIRGLTEENQLLRSKISGGYSRAGWGRSDGTRAPKPPVEPIADPSVK